MAVPNHGVSVFFANQYVLVEKMTFLREFLCLLAKRHAWALGRSLHCKVFGGAAFKKLGIKSAGRVHNDGTRWCPSERFIGKLVRS